MTETKQFTLIKLPLKELIDQNFHVHLDRTTEIEKGYLVTQQNSLLLDQIERLRGTPSAHIQEMILVVAKKNPRQEEQLRHLLDHGFIYNNVHYSRFGKSASQGKDGITAFICDAIFTELYAITQMDIPIEDCVISRYETQRCLIFSSCTLIPDYLPEIVIIDEYQKTIYDQLIKYVVERKREYTDPETGRTKTYPSKEIAEGYRDIPLSPFDGCGCHEQNFMDATSAALGLDYNAIGSQIRMPFMKGYSVYVPFRAILKDWGYEYITDVYGQKHHVDHIDCIWNVSMFKGHKIFTGKYGTNAWTEYMNTVRKYQFKLGISKYSHHAKNLNKKTRMNFQYLQCLNLWNPRYVDYYQRKYSGDYDILSPENEGKIISLAKYTTALYEKIIKEDKFYTYKFLGITDAETDEPANRYMEAVMINETMLQDAAVRKFIYRKLAKAITEAKVGKIYVDGFYHTIIGDMIGYLQYAVGEEPTGCLNERQFYCRTLPPGECVSFRSPLVCPSEVNKIAIVRNEITDRWFSYFQDQDVVMLNMYDISAPQQGGADFDGDIVFLCNDRTVVDAKIEKPAIIDIQDKTTAVSKAYTREHLIEYEIMTRDNRIGEITNVATSIENKYTENQELQQLYADYASLLRVFQGKEIDFLKTGFRWQMNKALRNHLKQLPYFLLFNYPQKMKTYLTLKQKNKKADKDEDKAALNAYHSPSPLNELCDYICTWEKKRIIWDRSAADTKHLIVNQDLDLSDKKIIRIVRHCINEYASVLKAHMMPDHKNSSHDTLTRLYTQKLASLLPELAKVHLANYVIAVSYSNLSMNKSFAWNGYGHYIIDNLKKNSSMGTTTYV